ncbi:MAG: LysR family transcriptional regulator, partial [Desulfobacteraceae bacterium]
MHLPVELLETFVKVAETKNFTAAGKRIHRSQSAVSMQMKRLTEIVGSPLFDINGKRIRLSPMGELLLDHARKILKAHETAATAITRSELKGKVRFGATEDYASLFVPDILAGFAEEYPDIRVDVICMPSVQLYSDLLQDKLDLALCTALDAGGEEVCAE